MNIVNKKILLISSLILLTFSVTGLANPGLLWGLISESSEGGPRADATRLGLRPASLDASQLECLQGMERIVGAVAVAYQRG